MSRKFITLALVGVVSLVAACDESGDKNGVTRALLDLGGEPLLAAFQADANSDPVNAQAISIKPLPRAEPFDPN